MTRLRPPDQASRSGPLVLAHVLLVGATACLSCNTPPGSGSLSAGDLVDSHGVDSSTSAATTAMSSGDASVGSGTTDNTGAATTTGDALRHDVGWDQDLGSSTPVGCDGKIDFLFVISRASVMKDIQDKLVEAFPAFINTIEGQFEEFDFNIMVVDGDDYWGSELCNELCTPEGCPLIDDYPCSAVDKITACDATLGAGTIFPAGRYATNAPCAIDGGRRYMTTGQTDLKDTFSCAARVGVSGDERVAEAMVAAISPEMNAPGGCNEGFLRDDALLMVTIIGSYDDHSAGTPAGWAKAVLDAKGGDSDATVLLSIMDPQCPPYDRVCEFAKKLPYHMIGHGLLDEYAATFDEAAMLIDEACEAFVPQ